MEEQNQNNENLKNDEQVQQDYTPVPNEELATKKNNWIIIVALLLLLILIGGGVYWWLQNNKTAYAPTQSNNNTVVQEENVAQTNTKDEKTEKDKYLANLHTMAILPEEVDGEFDYNYKKPMGYMKVGEEIGDIDDKYSVTQHYRSEISNPDYSQIIVNNLLAFVSEEKAKTFFDEVKQENKNLMDSILEYSKENEEEQPGDATKIITIEEIGDEAYYVYWYDYFQNTRMTTAVFVVLDSNTMYTISFGFDSSLGIDFAKNMFYDWTKKLDTYQKGTETDRVFQNLNLPGHYILNEEDLPEGFSYIDDKRLYWDTTSIGRDAEKEQISDFYTGIDIDKINLFWSYTLEDGEKGIRIDLLKYFNKEDLLADVASFKNGEKKITSEEDILRSIIYNDYNLLISITTDDANTQLFEEIEKFYLENEVFRLKQ